MSTPITRFTIEQYLRMYASCAEDAHSLLSVWVARATGVQEIPDRFSLIDPNDVLDRLRAIIKEGTHE